MINVKSSVFGAARANSSTASCSNEVNSCTMNDDDELAIASHDDVYLQNKADDKSKYLQRRLNEFKSWEDIRNTLFKTVIEEESFSNMTTCVICVKEAICRCRDCEARLAFCMERVKMQHAEGNCLHHLKFIR